MVGIEEKKVGFRAYAKREYGVNIAGLSEQEYDTLYDEWYAYAYDGMDDDLAD